MKESEHVDAFFAARPDQDTPANRRIVEEVNRRIDQFAHYPRAETLVQHRRYLHHAEGIEYFALVYGIVGEAAARQHVIEDCGHVPHARDYYDGTVDEFGGKVTMR